MKDVKANFLTCSFLWLAFLWIGAIFSPQSGWGQNINQTIRGSVLDELSGQPIGNASISLSGISVAVESDSLGRFRLPNIPIGRYVLTATAEGYGEYIIPDLVLHSGKEQVIEIELAPPLYQSESVEIAGGQVREVNQISTRLFTVEESKRFAAVYFDPARMASSYPGVVQNNDQTNHLVIRGNSPNGMGWRLEGVDIVNPNHTPNAGTFTDRLTQTGGGTIILSTQLLTNSTFSTGAFAPEYGNALSGIFDIHLRKGNDEKFEFTGQAGLIGVDVAAEGPLSKKNGSSFLVNYRYSTVGLLGLMGIDFEGESINYQDLAFNLHLPTKRAGTFSVFAMGGLSSNFFTGPREDSLRVVQKDRFDIGFVSNMGAAGLTHQLLLGRNTVWKSVFAVSGTESSRLGEFLDDNQISIPVEDDTLVQTRASFKSTISHRFNPKSSIEAGLYVTQLGYRLSSAQRTPIPGGDWQQFVGASGSYQLLQPFANFKYRLRSNLELNLGAHGMYFLLNGSRSVEPRTSLLWQIAPRHKVRVAYGLHSQLQLPGTYFTATRETDGSILNPNQDLDFTKAHHFVGSYDFMIRTDMRLHVEHYQQYLFNVPVIPSPNSTFSVLNLMEGYVTDSLSNVGSGKNLGWELSFEKYLSDNFYMLWSGMAYNAVYTAGDGIERAARFNGRFGSTLTAGWEFERLSKKKQPKVFGINGRVIYTGGFLAMPIDIEASRLAQRTVFDDSQGFTERYPAYFRVDLRFMFKRNGERFTRTFSLDIQNASNHQNVAFQTYDFLQDQVITKNQLGIIPLMSYRVEF
ncbi:MAG: TonB-dependent receptor [Bacteroidota bacterium]